jgi:Ran-binding protein 3
MDVQTKQGHPPSPARSDESNTERPVREKLKETRIDAQGTSDPAPASDQAMSDALANGTRAEPSTSGSDSERGRLRRKRSREHFEEDEEAKHPEKKHERHVRKKSREVTGFKVLDVESTATPAIAPSGEKNGDEIMRAQEDVEDEVADKCVTVATGVASPKNKRTREQAEDGTEIAAAPSAESKEESTATTKVDEERTTKRPRDAVDTETINGTAKDKTTVSNLWSRFDLRLTLA